MWYRESVVKSTGDKIDTLGRIGHESSDVTDQILLYRPPRPSQLDFVSLCYNILSNNKPRDASNLLKTVNLP